ncbi:MAG: hypothetical protein AAF310_03375 [Myxococcota bacterium]
MSRQGCKQIVYFFERLAAADSRELFHENQEYAIRAARRASEIGCANSSLLKLLHRHLAAKVRLVQKL